MITVLSDMDNQPMIETVEGKQKPVTFQHVMRGAFNSVQSAKEMSPDDKIKAFNLMVRPAEENGVVDFTPEEIGFILTWIKRQQHFSAAVIGRASEFFNQKHE